MRHRPPAALPAAMAMVESLLLGSVLTNAAVPLVDGGALVEAVDASTVAFVGVVSTTTSVTPLAVVFAGSVGAAVVSVTLGCGGAIVDGGAVPAATVVGLGNGASVVGGAVGGLGVGGGVGAPVAGVGAGVGEPVAPGEGKGVGAGVGLGVGEGVGEGVGNGVGLGVGEGVGNGVGLGVGKGVGLGVGTGVGCVQRVPFLLQHEPHVPKQLFSSRP